MIILSAFICSCDPTNMKVSSPSDARVCNCKEKEKIKEFVALSIKNANNMSNGEMENVIHQLELTGQRNICRSKQIYVFGLGYTGQHIDYTKTKLDSCETIMYYSY